MSKIVNRTIAQVFIMFVIMSTGHVIYNYITLQGFKEGYLLGVEAGYSEFMEHYEETCNKLPPENAEELCWKILYHKYGVGE